MVRAKNYEIASTFVKVIQKKLAYWLLFSEHGVYTSINKIITIVGCPICAKCSFKHLLIVIREYIGFITLFL